jgi:hypothetical protein
MAVVFVGWGIDLFMVYGCRSGVAAVELGEKLFDSVEGCWRAGIIGESRRFGEELRGWVGELAEWLKAAVC